MGQIFDYRVLPVLIISQIGIAFSSNLPDRSKREENSTAVAFFNDTNCTSGFVSATVSFDTCYQCTECAWCFAGNGNCINSYGNMTVASQFPHSTVEFSLTKENCSRSEPFLISTGMCITTSEASSFIIAPPRPIHFYYNCQNCTTCEQFSDLGQAECISVGENEAILAGCSLEDGLVVRRFSTADCTDVGVPVEVQSGQCISEFGNGYKMMFICP